jgi:hypothetical protein
MDFADSTHVQTTFYFFFNSQIATNIRTWIWKPSVAGQPTNTTKIDNAFLAAGIGVIYGTLIANGATMQGVRYAPQPNPMGLAPIYSSATNTAGTGGAVALPKQATALIRFKTLLLGGSGENRLYIPFPPATANETTGEPTATYIGLLNTMALILAGPVACQSTTGGSGQLIPTLNRRPTSTFPLTQIQAGLAGHAWATQRRRGDYGRTNRSPFA